MKKIKKDNKKKKKSRERNQSLSKEENEKKQQHGCEWFNNVPEHEKQKFDEYRKNYYKMIKHASL